MEADGPKHNAHHSIPGCIHRIRGRVSRGRGAPCTSPGAPTTHLGSSAETSTTHRTSPTSLPRLKRLGSAVVAPPRYLPHLQQRVGQND
eukprot:8399189-Pyramimonas_sp.AAC.1